MYLYNCKTLQKYRWYYCYSNWTTVVYLIVIFAWNVHLLVQLNYREYWKIQRVFHLSAIWSGSLWVDWETLRQAYLKILETQFTTLSWLVDEHSRKTHKQKSKLYYSMQARPVAHLFCRTAGALLLALIATPPRRHSKFENAHELSIVQTRVDSIYESS